MNPFDLSGPNFLFFYLCLGVVVILAARYYRHRAESGPAPKIELSDPYLIAYLRGGEKEAIKLAVITLIDRGLLTDEGAPVQQTEQTPSTDTLNPLESQVLKKAGTAFRFDLILNDKALKEACTSYRTALEQAGLIPNNSINEARISRCVLAGAILGTVSLTKIAIGVTRGRPVTFLIILTIATVAVLIITSFPRLTRRGQLALEDIQTLYAYLQGRAPELRRGSATPEMMMLAAAFGIAALAPVEYAYARSLFTPPPGSGGSGGSGCGSGSSCGSGGDSGGGGGCGGGGCGGCGGS